ncbi:hypothetical protein JAJEKKNP_00016 [Lumpy skin disease virus]|nr:hypothetical protein JAJEKKNP_00016 [Lumpy skin disease virus]
MILTKIVINTYHDVIIKIKNLLIVTNLQSLLSLRFIMIT